MTPAIDSPAALADQPLPHPAVVESYTPELESIFDTVEVIHSFDHEPGPDDDDDDDDDDFPPTQPG